MQQTKKRSIIPDNAQKKGCVPVCVIQIPPGGMPARQICSEYYNGHSKYYTENGLFKEVFWKSMK